MKHLKLIKGRSYSGPGVHATNAQPYISIEDDTAAEEALASGYFEEIEQSQIPVATLEVPDNTGDTSGVSGKGIGTGKLVETLNHSQLKRLNRPTLEGIGKKLGLDVSEAPNKDKCADDIWAALEERKVAVVEVDKDVYEIHSEAEVARQDNPDNTGGNGGVSGNSEDSNTTNQFTGNPDGGGNAGTE